MDFVVQGGREVQCLAAWKVLQDRVKSVLKTHLQHDIGFIDYHHLQVVSLKSISLLQMLQQSTRCADKNVHLANLLLFVFYSFTTDDQSNTDFHVGCKRVEYLEYLHGKLSYRDEDDSSKTVHRHDFVTIEFFDNGNKICKSLSRSCSAGSHHIPSSEGMWDDTSLYFCHFGKVLTEESLECKG
jgi:hypothetical protein